MQCKRKMGSGSKEKWGQVRISERKNAAEKWGQSRISEKQPTSKVRNSTLTRMALT
jgi:hypothetical protein